MGAEQLAGDGEKEGAEETKVSPPKRCGGSGVRGPQPLRGGDAPAPPDPWGKLLSAKLLERDSGEFGGSLVSSRTVFQKHLQAKETETRGLDSGI